MKKILVLFPKEWDRAELSSPRWAGRCRFCFEGFELFRFPENVRLLSFDVRRYLDTLEHKYRGAGLDGVFSNNEYFGALMAAELARRLGLPGTDPRVLKIAQHKFYCREVMARIAPEATPRFFAFPYRLGDRRAFELPFPFFVKPVKATFSVLARRVDNLAELRCHLRFGPLETLIIKRLVQPYNDLATPDQGFHVDAHHMIGEELLTGHQVNVDGFVRRGEVHFLGVVDSVMYPGTMAFQRFEYPSRLPAEVRARMRSLAQRLISGMGFDHGFFNVEMFWDPATDAIRLIEVNPRLASQLANLYRRVDGIDPYQLLVDLSLGNTPEAPRSRGDFGAAASFVFRRFDGTTIEREPPPQERDWLRRSYPDAQLMLYRKRGGGLRREMKWLGSHRYAVLNLGGTSRHDLERRFHAVCRKLALGNL
jgi:ATP-grasp domain-containing protein